MDQLQPGTHNLSKLTEGFKKVLGYFYYNLSPDFCVGFWHWEIPLGGGPIVLVSWD